MEVVEREIVLLLPHPIDLFEQAICSIHGRTTSTQTTRLLVGLELSKARCTYWLHADAINVSAKIWTMEEENKILPDYRSYTRKRAC